MPGVISVKTPSEPTAELLAKIVPSIVRGDFPVKQRTRKRDGQARPVATVSEVAWGMGALKNNETRERVADGDTLFAFWHKEEDFLPAELTAIRTDSVELPVIDARLLRWLAGIVTDKACAIAGDGHPALLPAQIDVAFAYGIDPAECQRRVAAMGATTGEIDISPSPMGFVKSLSDLPTFGPATRWGLHLAQDIADYRAGTIAWRDVDRGALIAGPPGVGKTTYARALAKSCAVEMISTSVSTWYTADHLGVTLKKMKGVFAEAAELAPCILFIDEVDGIGDREKLSDRHRDYFTQIINKLLECMDGIDRREGVIVVGACNYPDRVDPALKRPGRLDRIIRIPLPDAETLEVIYRHSLGDDLADIDLAPLAAISVGATGADLELWVRSARRSARRNGRAIKLEDLVAEARGATSDLPPALLRRVAVHEAGHAAAAVLLGLSNAVSVTIGTRGMSLGTTVFESEATWLDTRETALAMATYVLAGRAAEDVLLGSISSGSGGPETSDLARATSILASMEASYGLGSNGSLLWFGAPSDAMVVVRHPRIAAAVEEALSDAYRGARELIVRHADGVQRIADELQRCFHASGDHLLTLLQGASSHPITGKKPDPVGRRGIMSTVTSSA
jgi:Cdc6-like AAA superfamily ATPase